MILDATMEDKREKWVIDMAHSELSFKVKHLMIAYVKGSFRSFDASIYTTGKDFSSAEIDIWIDPASISTGDEKRDEHLKGPDFFDVLNHPQIAFTSETIGEADSNGNHELWGELRMKGIKKNLKLNVQFGGIMMDPWNNEKAGFTVTGVIKRSEWGLTWNTAIEAGGIVVSEEVKISCEIELTRVNQKDLSMVLE